MKLERFDDDMVGKVYESTRYYKQAKIVWLRRDSMLATIEYYSEECGCNTQIAIPFRGFQGAFVKWIDEE